MVTRKMVLAQGFAIADDGTLTIPEGADLRMRVPTELVPMCPVCGERPIKLVSGDEFTDTYQCPNCGSKSTHTKKLRPIPHPGLTCPRCGSIGKWRIVESANGTDTVECTVCRLSTKVPAEQN